MSKYKIGDLINTISITHSFNKERLIFLNTSDILNGKILTNNYSITDTLPGQAKKTIENGDILFSEIRPKNKRFCFIKNLKNTENYIVSTKLMVLRPKKNQNILNNEFMYYFLTGEQVLNRLHLIAQNRSGTFPQITFEHIANLNINLPPLEEQQKIADILSSLDAKIEINNKINKELEEIAQALYTKWFVNFDFPNKEGKPYKSSGGEMVESELGLIPAEWKVGKIGELVDFVNGYAFKKNSYVKEGVYRVVTIKNITKNKLEITNRDSMVNIMPNSLKESQKLKIGDIIMSLTGEVGRVCIVDRENCLLNQRVGKIEAQNNSAYVYQLLSSKEMYISISNLATGSIQQNVSTNSILNIKKVIPSKLVLDLFENVCLEIRKSIISNSSENQQLKETRDLLLPYLMSGKIVLK